MAYNIFELYINLWGILTVLIVILLGRFALTLSPKTMHAWLRLPMAICNRLASATRRPRRAATCHVAVFSQGLKPFRVFDKGENWFPVGYSRLCCSSDCRVIFASKQQMCRCLLFLTSAHGGVCTLDLILQHLKAAVACEHISGENEYLSRCKGSGLFWRSANVSSGSKPYEQWPSTLQWAST